ncbi:hypothetical protein EDD17DRAFT_1516407 [Pisolithus thermaeus]|nr:hypothetical protein EDD17DRAFT_1516407 [Pisolithus thermaeus]
MRTILFVRVNNNLYAYSNERLSTALTNIHQGTPPPVPTRWDRGIMGPIGLINTAEDIHKLYAQAYNEPEEKAPCVCRVQDLVTYINLWKKCKLEMNERMEAACLGLPKIVPEEGALQQWLEDHSAAPLPEMEQRPIIPLHDHVMVKNPRASQAPTSHQRPLTRGQPFHPRGGVQPSGRKTRGGIPKLPQEAPPLDAPVQDWVRFIQMYQNRYSGSDESSELSRMFPGALGISECPDDDEWEISPPSTQMVQGFLLYKQLAPVPRRDHDQMVWFWELVHLLAARGCYRALLNWAEVSPHTRPQVPWEGTFSRMATMADVAAYLAANGITPHTADNAITWAHRADPNVQAVVDLLRVAIHNPHPPSENWLVEWVNQQAQALGISPERIAAYEAHTFEAGEVYILQEFAVTVALYDLPHLPRGDDQGMSGDSPAGTWEAEEGELLDRPAPM